MAIVVGVGGYLAAGADFGPVFLAPALGIYAMATALPLRRWVPLTALLVPMIMAGHWREPYLGLLNPGLYAGLVVGVAVAVVPAMFALLRRSRRENERVPASRTGGGTRTRSGCGSPATCTTWSVTACR